MKSYHELKKDFEKKVLDLQNSCPHKKITWMEKWWALGHSTGKIVAVCDYCNKELETKSIPDDWDYKKYNPDWKKKNRKVE